MRALRLPGDHADATLLRVSQRLNLVASVGSTGIAGTPTGRVVDPATGAPYPVPSWLVGGHGALYRQLFSFDALYWSVGLTLDLPLSTAARVADARKERLVIAAKSAELRAARAQVAVQVRDAYLRLRIQSGRTEEAARRIGVARETLEVAQERFHVGLIAAVYLLRAQQDFADAERGAVRAEVDHAVTRAALELTLDNLAAWVDAGT